MPDATRRPLGATPSLDGTTTFRVRSVAAGRLELCLLDAAAGSHTAERRVTMRREGSAAAVWSVTTQAGHGQRYGFRSYDADGAGGSQLLLDPYGRFIDVDAEPCSVVCAERSAVPDARPASTPGGRVIYEAHLARLTRRLPDVPAAAAGTFTALRSRFLIEHLLEMGVTTLELLPVMHWASERAVLTRGMRNVWGYNPLGFFSPAPWYCIASTIDEQWDEIATSVGELHAAGLEVVLDVVYNHTAEGDQDEPPYHLRGLDDAAYYRTDDAGQYDDVTGCGNTLDAADDAVQDLVIDSLRHWVRNTDVDGFRFDLAVALGRAPEFDPRHPLLTRIGADELLGDRLLIAEPWDLGPGGWRTGEFSTASRAGGWLEWNDEFRAAVRDFWRPGPQGTRARLVTALAGSSTRFAPRNARSSVGYVTAHDGFTLRDLTSYETKHNLANGEQNRDGTDQHQSYNGGIEGPSDNPQINELRLRRASSMLACVMLQIGTPMLNAGDELWRTQHGNNNTYCRDDADLDLDWGGGEQARHLTGLLQQLAAVRREHAELFDGRWLRAPRQPGDGHVVQWLDREARVIEPHEWDADSRVLTVLFPATATRGPLAIAINGTEHPVQSRMPADQIRWRVGIDTAGALQAGLAVLPEEHVRLEAFSLVVLAD